jgi:hypothetical protein
MRRCAAKENMVLLLCLLLWARFLSISAFTLAPTSEWSRLLCRRLSEANHKGTRESTLDGFHLSPTRAHRTVSACLHQAARRNDGFQVDWRRNLKKVGLRIAKLLRQAKQRAFGEFNTGLPVEKNLRPTVKTILSVSDPEQTPSVLEPIPSDSTSTLEATESRVHPTQDATRSVAVKPSPTLKSMHLAPNLDPPTSVRESLPFDDVSVHDSVESESVQEQVELAATFADSAELSQRWALAAPTTDLSGTWKPIISTAFKAEYDKYLLSCGEGIWFRKTLLSVLNMAKEVIVQRLNGRELSITGVTPIGGWERTLVASGEEPCDVTNNASDDTKDKHTFEPIYTSFRDPDGDTVQVEAWWESHGSVHKSWLRHKPRFHGGEVESTRYLESDNVLVCESIFHPPLNEPRFQYAKIVWKFQRQ